jgi:hypothetical protein
MFTSLRNFIDVRLLPLIAVLLLSACALHRPDAEPDAAPTPSSDEPVLPHIVLPEFDIPVPEVIIPDPATSEPTSPTITRWVTQTPSFTLVTTSAVASEHATAALQATSLAFARLFGEHAPRIAVAIVDTSKGRSAFEVPEPPAGITSIVMVVSGLAGPDSAATAAALTSELRFEAASAFIFDYAQDWGASLAASGVTSEPAPNEQAIPDWMHLGLLRILTDPNPTLIRAESPISLDAMFSGSVSQGQANAALSVVRGPSDAASIPADGDSVEWRSGLVFTNEATSLLTFLRQAMGDRSVANIFGATVAGLSMPEILRGFRDPITTSELEVAFDAWTKADVTASIRRIR